MERDVELAGQLAKQLFRLIRTIERKKAQAAAARGDGMERACFGLLVELADRGPMRMTALADAVLADPSTVSRQVTQLVQLGYVQRQADPGDGRASRLAATSEGMRHLEEMRGRRNRWIAEVLGEWSAAETTELVRLLGRFNDDIESHRDIEHHRPQLATDQQRLRQEQV